MKKAIWITLALCGTLLTSACAPLIGAGAVVAADKAVENEDGGDGLF